MQLSIKHRLHVYDMAVNELGLIKEKALSSLPLVIMINAANCSQNN